MKLNKLTQTYLKNKVQGYLSKDQKAEDLKEYLRLDLGENLLGYPEVTSVLHSVNEDTLRYYADPSNTAIKKIISELYNISTRNVSIANSTDEIIDLIPRMILSKPDRSLVIIPTFFRIVEASMQNRAKVIPIRLSEENGYKSTSDLLDKICTVSKKNKVSIIWICNPNNPTGEVWDLDEIEKIAQSSHSLVVVDEVYYDIDTPNQLRTWQQTQMPVELSIVAVMPNKDIVRLPVGALSYAATALDAISNLKAKSINVGTLRIISPCHINEYCAGGNLQKQLQNAAIYQKLVLGYKDAYYPELAGVAVTLDTGKEIDNKVVASIQEKINQLQQQQPDVLAMLVSKLSGRAERHKKGNVDRPIDEKFLTIAYLLAHPEAWGYSDDDILFAKNGEQRINFMPASELSYLSDITKVNRIWSEANNHIVTAISKKQITPPYHGRKGEASLGTLLEFGKEAGIYEKLISDAVCVQGEIESLETVYALRKIHHDTRGKENVLINLLREAHIKSQGGKPRLT